MTEEAGRTCGLACPTPPITTFLPLGPNVTCSHPHTQAERGHGVLSLRSANGRWAEYVFGFESKISVLESAINE